MFWQMKTLLWASGRLSGLVVFFPTRKQKPVLTVVSQHTHVRRLDPVDDQDEFESAVAWRFQLSWERHDGQRDRQLSAALRA
eukprot:5107910-Pleurochrysis_carterae.AAC.1